MFCSFLEFLFSRSSNGISMFFSSGSMVLSFLLFQVYLVEKGGVMLTSDSLVAPRRVLRLAFKREKNTPWKNKHGNTLENT